MSNRAGSYRAPADMDVRGDLLKKYPDLGDLVDIYAGIEGATVHKWHHYLPIYDRYMARFRGTRVRMLEIGVAQGGSLALWRKYLGPDAVLFGIDIREGCIEFNGINGQVRIGSQDDPVFLESVVREMGGLDLVLDDGSHEMQHIEASLKVLFPLLESGGTYMIEDLHTAYWTRWGGGLKVPENFFRTIDRVVDDMHHWYHEGEINRPALYNQVTGVHVHDSLVILDKGIVYEPIHSYVGNATNARAEERRRRRKGTEAKVDQPSKGGAGETSSRSPK